MLTLLILPTFALQQIGWAPSVQVAQSYAKKSGKPIMLVFAPELGGRQLEYCLADPRTVELSSRFVCVRLPVDESPSFAKIKAAQVRMPILFTEHDGTVIGRVGGFFWPKDVTEYMKLALWSRSPTGAPRTAPQRATMAAFRMEYSKAHGLLKGSLQGVAPDASISEASLVLGDQYRAERLFKESIEPLKVALKFAATPRQVFRARIRLASSYTRLNDLTNAEVNAQKCVQMAGNDKDDKEVADFHMSRIQAMKPLIKGPKA